MRNRHWLLSSLLLLCAAVALGSCKNPASPGADDEETASAPTVAALVGTWKMNSSSSSSGATTLTQYIITVSADGTFVQESITTSTPSSGSPTTTNTWTNGTISTSGDNLTIDITGAASGAASEPSSWTNVSMSMTTQAILVGNKFYMEGVGKAQGSNTGIVGTWLSETHTKMLTDSYQKFLFTFSSDMTFTVKTYTSSTSTYPSDPSRSESGTYVLNSNGSIALTFSGDTTSSTFFYKVLGSYLIQGSETSVDANAYIKQ